MSKNIVLFIDGTWNEPHDKDPSLNTNVVQLCEASVKSPAQLVRYLRGVGTDHPSDPDHSGVLERTEYFLKTKAGGIAGYGTSHRIKKAYQFLSENYEYGDRIYLFGFSRGAFAARSLAGFAERVGLLLRRAAKDEYVDAAYYIYEHGRDKRNSLVRAFLREIVDQEEPRAEESVLPIHFIGVWDTVAAQGLPSRAKILSAAFTEYHQTELPANITHARHALALHELRREFEPLLWTIRSHEGQSLIQRWFAGAHSDVGGGSYPEKNWSEVALGWMANEAVINGLQLKHTYSYSCGDSSAPIHQANEGLEALYPIGVREAIAATHGLSEVTRNSYQLDQGGIDRIFKSQKYDFAKRYVECLEKVDDITLQMAIDLCLKDAVQQSNLSSEIPEWLKGVRVIDFFLAKERTTVFLENRHENFSAEKQADLIRSLSAMCLGNDTGQLRDFAKAVLEASQIERALPVGEDFKEPDDALIWAVRATTIVDGALASILLLPQDNQPDLHDVFSSLKTELTEIQSERRLARWRPPRIRFKPRE
jgi:uncharacterized protein (DUF2235 family)